MSRLYRVVCESAALRLAPSTSAASVDAPLARGATCRVVATRGLWVRVEATPPRRRRCRDGCSRGIRRMEAALEARLTQAFRVGAHTNNMTNKSSLPFDRP